MESTNNLYIDALKFGVTRMQKGLTYNEMRHHLVTCMGWAIDENYEGYLRLWFLRNFFNKDISPNLLYGNAAQVGSVVREGEVYNDHVGVMTAEAYEQLLDYEKLQETRNSSAKAQRLALIAIVISGGLALAQIILQCYSMNTLGR